MPAFIDNDANLMGLGEARVHYADSPSVLFVKVGTGIGAGLILHGQPERGIAGGAGDIGHIRGLTSGADADARAEQSAVWLPKPAAPRSCDSSWRRASMWRLRRMSCAWCRRDIRDADRLVRQAGRLLGDVLASAVALLNPAVLVLGGSLSTSGDTLLDPVRQSIFARTVPLATRELTIASSTLGVDAAVHGARHLVIDQTFSADAVDARFATHQ